MTKNREEFESWAKTTFLRAQLYWSEEQQLYRVFPVQCAWISWQAAKLEEPNDPDVVKELEKMIEKRCMAGEIGVNTSRKMLRVIHPEWSKGGHIPATVSYRVGEKS